MIIVYEADRSGAEPCIREKRALEPGEAVPPDAVWIDLVEPTRDEDHRLERFLGVSVPTREEMQDIEPSEVLYVEQDARYMTVRLLCRSDSEDPVLTGVTFILKGKTLVTVRYDEPRSINMFAQRFAKGGVGTAPIAMLGAFVETISDRAADVLQMAGERIDHISRRVFAARKDPAKRNMEYQLILRSLGQYGELVSKQRESLVSVERAILFLSASNRLTDTPKEVRDQLRATQRDLQSLEEHASFLTNKVQFLLDATLGLVNLEQNNIIKIFSVVSVIFMPPTLIASIYGMNFKHMPELEWLLGYPMALVMMLVAAILPYAFFRWRGWL